MAPKAAAAGSSKRKGQAAKDPNKVPSKPRAKKAKGEHVVPWPVGREQLWAEILSQDTAIVHGGYTTDARDMHAGAVIQLQERFPQKVPFTVDQVRQKQANFKRAYMGKKGAMGVSGAAWCAHTSQPCAHALAPSRPQYCCLLLGCSGIA